MLRLCTHDVVHERQSADRRRESATDLYDRD